MLDLLEDIYGQLDRRHNGVGWAQGQDLLDIDDTATTLQLQAILRRAGRWNAEIDAFGLDALDHFMEPPGRAACYKYEGDPSHGSTLHLIAALEAYLTIGDLHREERAKAQLMLQQATTQMVDLFPRGYGYSITELLHDKWHMSRYYGARSWLNVESVFIASPEMTIEIVEHLLDHQDDNGGFGEVAVTTEETAYAISGLYGFLRNLHNFQGQLDEFGYQDIDQLKARVFAALGRANAYLGQTISEEGIDIIPLWISKNLYSALGQITTGVIDALELANHIDFANQTLDPEYLPARKIDPELIRSKEHPDLAVLANLIKFTREITGKDYEYFTDGEKFSQMMSAMIEVDNGVMRWGNAIMIGLDAIAEHYGAGRRIEALEYLFADINQIAGDAQHANQVIEEIGGKALQQGGFRNLSPEDCLRFSIARYFQYNQAILAEKLGQDVANEHRAAVTASLIAHNQAQVREAKLIAGSGDEWAGIQPGAAAAAMHLDETLVENIPPGLLEGLGSDADEESPADKLKIVAATMQNYAEHIGAVVGVKPILQLAQPHMKTADPDAVTLLDDIAETYTKILSIANQILVEPELLNLGLMVYAELSGRQIDEQLRSDFFGEGYEIDPQRSPLAPKTRQMHQVQALMRYVFAGHILPQLQEELEMKLVKMQDHELAPQLQRLSKTIEMIASKLQTDDVEFVMDFLGIPPDQQRAIMAKLAA